MIPTATLLTAAFGLITSAIAAQAADANIQIAALSQRSLPTYSLTDTGSFEPPYGDRSASDINFLGHVVGFEKILQIVRPFLYANGRSIDLTLFCLRLAATRLVVTRPRLILEIRSLVI
jgi:hypothetical protein